VVNLVDAVSINVSSENRMTDFVSLSAVFKKVNITRYQDKNARL